MKLLQITSGLFGENSQSTSLVRQFSEQYAATHDGLEVISRDLVADPVPHLDANIVSAFMTAESERTSEQHKIVAFSDELINEIKQADSIVLGLPMYNFGISSQLKAYFDQLARAGVTFTYTENGPKGLLDDKPVYILAARGGFHKGQSSDAQTGFLSTIFEFIGIKDLNFIYAEGLNMGEDKQSNALDAAKQEIESVMV